MTLLASFGLRLPLNQKVAQDEISILHTKHLEPRGFKSCKCLIV